MDGSRKPLYAGHFTHNCQPGCVCDEGLRLHESRKSHEVDRVHSAQPPQEFLELGHRKQGAEILAQRQWEADILALRQQDTQREQEADLLAKRQEETDKLARSQRKALIQAQISDPRSLSITCSESPLDTRAMLEYELGRERRREARWLDEAVAQDTSSRGSRDARPQKRRRADSPTENDETHEKEAKRRRLAGRWAVKPEHFDLEIDRPKLWVEDDDGDDGDEVLSPWGLKYFDRNPGELKAMGRACQDAYHDGEGSERVTHFRMRPAIGPPPKLSPAHEEVLRLRSEQAKKVTREKKTIEQEAPFIYTVRIGTLFQPISGWMPFLEDEDDEQPLAGYDGENSSLCQPRSPKPRSPQSPQSSPPQFPQATRNEVTRDTVKQQSTSSAIVEQKRGMPVPYCFIVKRYRPRPWGDGERMPKGSYTVSAGAEDNLLCASMANSNVKEIAAAIQKPASTARDPADEPCASTTAISGTTDSAPIP